MDMTFVSESALNDAKPAVEGSFEDIGGERFYRVANYDAMPVFFMSLVSDSDHWLFISSNGALTAGRKDADHALFPYCTEDRIHDSLDQTGGKTILRVSKDRRTRLWEPFSQRYEGLYRTTRNLYKSVYGNKILFEEINHDLGLSFRCAWMNSERFGFVRRATLINQSEEAVTVDLVDGIQNVLPYGLGRRFQMEFSNLGDGYKRTELLGDTGLALFRLSSIPVDRAEPSEALRVNLAWSAGLASARHLLSVSQLGAFRRGEPLHEETDVRGQRGAYLLNATLDLAPRAREEWYIVAEVSQDSVGVHGLKKRLDSREDLRKEILEDVDRGTQNLVRIVASADGLQVTEDELSTRRHFSNTLFNVMRGGIPDDGYRISRTDLKSFLTKANQEVTARHASFLDSLPETLLQSELIARVSGVEDPDLYRLACEYLPLTFSRRHGDPSRPWNIFSIQVKDDHGRKILGYEGNWRDIFQNWEATARAFPGFVEGMIFKFMDSSTADGYNPYRVMRDGFEWELIDPDDAWSFIGYWGDHQVIYLLKLLEVSQAYHPGGLARLLRRRVFTYANVPYRIKPYKALLSNPRDTITFDHDAHREAMARVEKLGTDGKVLVGTGGISRANLMEKLLVVILSKLSNFVPEGGIWMNTQRPEWNDANNALVGYGVSMVTLCYLRRFLSFCRELFPPAGSEEFEISREIAELLDRVALILGNHVSLLGGPILDRDRKVILDALGQAGADYRERIYTQGFSGELSRVSRERLCDFCDAALQHIDHAIRGNRREDGLYHAYNLMRVAGDGVEVRNLYEMLEGQVAVLSSGALSVEDSVAVLEALRSSRLYRPDQASYILYPDRTLPHFLEKNNIPAGAVEGSQLLLALLDDGDGRLVARDVEGQVHFNAAFRNAMDLKEVLEAMKDGGYRELVEREETQLLDLYERVFDHQSFTGRSGTFFKYEGLGCVYWHMVSKLLLAVDEVQQKALTRGTDPATLALLKAHYLEIREGIGVHKSPAGYGAIPTDPYSHTPGFSGAQQPGMTGQVKEDFITRQSEMGMHVERGCLGFLPGMVARAEFLIRPATFRFFDVEGRNQQLELGKDSLAFTICQVPVVVHREGSPCIAVTRGAGGRKVSEGLLLDTRTSAAIFERTGEVQRLDVYFGSTQ